MAGMAQGTQSAFSKLKNPVLIALFCTALAACGDDASSAAADTGASTASQMANAEADAVLGPVNEPRPDWLPGDFPLPADTHIYLTAVNTTSSPDMYQLQARTLAEKDAIIADAMRWAESRGLHPSDEGTGGNLPSTFAIMAFDGVQFSPSNMQVTDEGGRYRRIILSVVGPPWE